MKRNEYWHTGMKKYLVYHATHYQENQLRGGMAASLAPLLPFNERTAQQLLYGRRVRS